MKKVFITLTMLFFSTNIFANNPEIASCIDSAIQIDKLDIEPHGDVMADVYTFVANSKKGRKMWDFVNGVHENCKESSAVSKSELFGSGEQINILQKVGFCIDKNSDEKFHTVVRYDLTDEGAPICYSMF